MTETTGKRTLSIGGLDEGFVLDHIQAGHAMTIYRYLHLGDLDCTVAIIKNAESRKMGRKDIIKVACPIDYLDLSNFRRRSPMSSAARIRGASPPRKTISTRSSFSQIRRRRSTAACTATRNGTESWQDSNICRDIKE